MSLPYDDKEAAFAYVDKHLTKYYHEPMARDLARFAEERAAAEREPAPTPKPVPPPTTTRDAPESLLNSVTDPERNGELRFANAGPLHSVPRLDAQPDLVKRFAELVEDQGQYLKTLPERVTVISRLASDQERRVQATKLIGELERFAGPAENAMRAKAGELRAAAAELEKSLTAPGGDDIMPEHASRIAAWFLELSEADRVAFLNRAERTGDYRVLRAVASDPLTPYAAPTLQRDQLIETAGRLRTPGTAKLAAALRQLGDRAVGNADRVAAITTEMARASRQYVSEADLAFVGRVATGG